MSTILDTLKRLEKKDGTRDAMPTAWRSSGRAQPLNPRFRRRRLAVIAGLAVLLGGAGVFWHNRDRQTTPVASPVEPSPAEQVAAGTPTVLPTPTAAPIAAAPAGDAPQANRRSLHSGAGTPPVARRLLTAPDYKPPDPEGSTTRVRSPNPPSRAVSVSAALPDPRTSDRDPPSRAESRPADKLPPGPPDPYARAEVLSEEAFVLQAISWSDRPTARVTIIAGRILREGQTVDGYTVVEIRPEDVILAKGDRHWKVVYSGR